MEQTTPRIRITDRQKRDLRKLLYDSLDELGLDNPSAQRVLGKGGTLKSKVKDILRELATADDLLEFVATVEMPAIDRFSVSEVIKTGKIGDVEFSFGENFQRVFGSLVETNNPATTLRISRLKKGSVDGPIIAGYGGEKQAATFIAYMFEMAKKQGHGEEGVLLTNGWATVIHVPDPQDPKKFWAVHFFWRSGGRCWFVEAIPVANPRVWYADFQFVSRDLSGS